MAFHFDTLIATATGLRPIWQLADQGFPVYDGTEYRYADAVRAPETPLERTLLINGLVLSSDREQRFLVAPAGVAGPGWTPQRMIRPGDRVLMPYARYDYAYDEALLFVGKDYGGWSPTASLTGDLTFWRLLGFALADGYLPAELPSEDAFRVFLYDQRNVPLLRRFAKCCKRHRIDAVITEKQHPLLTVHHGPFQRWLRDLGFRSMSEGLRLVPPTLFGIPAWMREAVLAGFFSCWGEWAQHSVHGHYTPHVHVKDPQLRQGILQLLWSVGVAASVEQRGWVRSGDIFIRDIGRFQEQVNFIQEHKRIPFVERNAEREGKWDTLRHETTVYLCRNLSEKKGWKSLHADEREKLLRHRYGGTGVRRTVAIEMCHAIGIKPPDWLRYHHAPVDAMTTIEVAPPLYDLRFETEQKRRYVAGFATCR